MDLDLREQLLDHPGELGTEREEVVRQFLRNHLPGTYGVGTGFVFDSNHAMSEQVDIVIYDHRSCPPLQTSGGKQFFPVESVIAVGQVKSRMTSQNVFKSCWKNIASVKRLDRSADGWSRDYWTGRSLNHRTNHLDQVFGFVFVIGECLTRESLLGDIYEEAIHCERHEWTNLVFAFGTRLATYACPDGICANAMHAEGIGFFEKGVEGCTSEELLVEFYQRLADAVHAVRFACPPYAKHLRGASERQGVKVGPFRFGPPWPDDGSEFFARSDQANDGEPGNG